MNTELHRFDSIPLRWLPRQVAGVDYGTNKRRVLVEYGPRRIVWTGGCSYFGGQGRPQAYAEAKLDFYDDEDRYRSIMGKTIHSGGRLSRRLLSAFEEEINTLLGVRVGDRLDPCRTLIVTDLA